MEHILDSPDKPENELNYAGFWVRVAAYIIDAIILGIFQLILASLFFGGYDFFTPKPILHVLSTVIAVLYFAVMESSERQGTVGKMAVGIKVGDFNGECISLTNGIGRYFAKILSALFFLIGFMMIGWDSKKQGLHDKLANTYVFYA